MMVDRGWSVSISSILVSATFVSLINMDITGAQKISNAMLDDILGDIASQYQSADYGYVNSTYGHFSLFSGQSIT